MLSLSPRFDLFRFELPKDFLPDPIIEKYQKILDKSPGVLNTPIDYLNESIQGINFPGISDVVIAQAQHSSNSFERKLGKFNIEPKTDVTYATPSNPIDKIDKKFKITFRLNQGLYNYFMLYETIFYRVCKPLDYGPDKVLYIELLDEEGTITSRIKFFDVYINGIEGLDFNFNKLERDSGTFDVEFSFNNIDYEFVNV